jgi:dihydrofolate reductase
MSTPITLIFAVADNGVIGKQGAELPWHQAADIKRFKTLTSDHTVIMGRKTYESMGKPLPDRRNLIISRNPDFKAVGCEIFTSLEAAIKTEPDLKEVFVIGGARILKTAMPLAHTLYLTLIHGRPDGNVYFDYEPNIWTEISSADYAADADNDFDYSFKVLEK